MGSLAAAEVAKDVLGSIGRGERPNITKIAIKNGYSPKTANAGLVQKTKTYKKTIAPFLERLEKHREKVLLAMEGKRLGKEEYQVLSTSLTKLTHDVQLLSGGKTENIGVEEDRQTLKVAIAMIRA